jgi:DNA-directed RNA polymerase subunit RPC12/RpoP
MRNQIINDDFRCMHCRHIVSANPILSGVQNRNHCPYCLWSRHLDLNRAGDRMSACKAQMRPVGLTLKRAAKRYGPSSAGELMLIHECIECGKVSINRIAADDFAENLFEIFANPSRLDPFMKMQLERGEIRALQPADREAVSARLFGKN